MHETLLKPPTLCQFTSDLKSAFRLFIACEDHAALAQANKVQAQVAALCDNVEVSRALWNFPLLRHQTLREHALIEAADADMIIISFRASNALPEHVTSWLETLPARAQPGQAAMVALIGAGKQAPAAWRSQVAYLRKIADSRGLDFFCNHDTWETFELPHPAFRPTEHPSMLPHHILSFPAPWTSGGINE